MAIFCPKCGTPDQSIDAFCRRCGTFLPDPFRAEKKTSPPEENIKVNTVLSMMTVIVCFALAIVLYAVLGFRPGTHPLIYVTAGLLIAMGAWHIQTFIRVRRLKKQWKERRPSADAVEDAAKVSPLLAEPDFEHFVPASVTDRTTRQLADKRKSSAKS